MKISKTYLSLFLVVNLFVAFYGNCFGDSLYVNSSKEVIYDDYGKIITEDEIKRYTDPDLFWDAANKGIGYGLIGGAIGLFVGMLTNNNQDAYGGISTITLGMAGELMGMMVGVTMSQAFPTKGKSRLEAINIIKDKRNKGIKY